MSISNIEKQQEKLKKLNDKIKKEKKKVEQRLGREIIKNANLDYANLDQKTIKELASKIVSYLNENNFDNPEQIEHMKPDESNDEVHQQ